MTPMIAWAEQWWHLAYCWVPLHLRMSPAGIAECRGWQQRQRCDDRHTDEVASMHGIPPYVAQTVSTLIMQHIRLQIAGWGAATY